MRCCWNGLAAYRCDAKRRYGLDSHHRGNRGLTFLEVIIVLAIITLAMALVLPAVQRVREAARQHQCQYNLKQLALAAHNFHSQHETLPYENASGFIGNRGWIPGTISAWAQLLPHIDQSLLYSQIDFRETGIGIGSEPSTSSQNAAVLTVRLPLLQCPSDQAKAGSVSYRTCQGTSSLYAPIVPPTPTWGRPGACYSLGINRRRAPFSSISDGLSNTALLSEKVIGDQNPAVFNPVRDIAFTNLNATAFDEPDDVIKICNSTNSLATADHGSFGGETWLFSGYANTWYNHILTPNSRTIDCAEGGLHYFEAAATARSWHSGGVNLALADGAVRFVSEQIDLRVWRAVGTRSEGEVIREW